MISVLKEEHFSETTSRPRPQRRGVLVCFASLVAGANVEGVATHLHSMSSAFGVRSFLIGRETGRWSQSTPTEVLWDRTWDGFREKCMVLYAQGGTLTLQVLSLAFVSHDGSM